MFAILLGVRKGEGVLEVNAGTTTLAASFENTLAS